ncbi:MAG: hypothetical protein M1829_004568 [Trizodia sp. TS-e1964]|nr:MAG: hypothetical protein M1829_004568 [Trizodia sp. TS-e1964]
MSLIGKVLFIAYTLSALTTAIPSPLPSRIERPTEAPVPGGLLTGPGLPHVSAYETQSKNVPARPNKIEPDLLINSAYAEGVVPHLIALGRLPQRESGQIAVLFSIVTYQAANNKYLPRHGLYLQVYRASTGIWSVTRNSWVCIPRFESPPGLMHTLSTVTNPQLHDDGVGTIVAWRAEGIVPMERMDTDLWKVIQDTMLLEVADLGRVEDLEVQWVSSALANLREIPGLLDSIV